MGRWRLSADAGAGDVQQSWFTFVIVGAWARVPVPLEAKIAAARLWWRIGRRRRDEERSLDCGVAPSLREGKTKPRDPPLGMTPLHVFFSVSL